MIIFLEILDCILIILMCLTIHRVDVRLRGLLLTSVDLIKNVSDKSKALEEQIKKMKLDMKKNIIRIDELEDEIK